MATRRERVLESIQDFYQQIYDGLEQKTLENEFGSYILGRVKSGRKQTYNKTQVEIRQFNLEFLDVIESTYPALLKIMKDPKRSIRYEQEIVNVEKAKKVNSDTVKHLSSHTHLTAMWFRPKCFPHLPKKNWQFTKIVLSNLWSKESRCFWNVVTTS